MNFHSLHNPELKECRDIANKYNLFIVIKNNEYIIYRKHFGASSERISKHSSVNLLRAALNRICNSEITKETGGTTGNKQSLDR